ncbi:hypothetical protein AAH978_12690 [Streptomyces sp. ZYX-F-203]
MTTRSGPLVSRNSRWQCSSGRPPLPSSQAGYGSAAAMTIHSASAVSEV